MSSGLHPDAAPAVLDGARVRALASTALLDTPPEDEFDRLTALTARVSGAPVSVVALIDADRSYFKSAHGVPEVPPGRTVPLSHSLCQHVVGRGAPLVIDDARSHPLVRDNGGVTELGIGAYLGVPVRAPSGHVLGSLCAIDVHARTWTDEDQTSLASLAASVESEIALRAELAERQAAEALALAEAEALAAVVGINAQLAAELDPDRLVQAVVDAGTATTGAAVGAFFYRPVGGGDEALLFAAAGVAGPALSAFAVFRSTPESRAAFAAPVQTADLHADPAWAWVASLVRDRVDVRSLLGMPVVDASGDSIGTLIFGHPAPGAFGARAERAAQAIADQAAIGLQNARLHRALDESERHHRTVLAGLTDVVFQTDAEGRYTYLNDAWADRTGHAVEVSVGRSFLDFVAADAEALAAQLVERAARATPQDPTASDLHVEVACADGSVRHVEVRGRFTFDARGVRTGSAGTLTDVTDRVRYHSEREAREAAEAARLAADEARVEAERMARLQSSFLANMSHEIRTPLTAILGNAEFLADEAPDDLRALAVSIQSGGQRLMATLNSVLDLAQIDAGQMAPRPRPVDLHAHLTAALEAIAPLAERKGLALYSDLAADASAEAPTVLVDPGLLDRAVSNLLGNAVKFTAQGSVLLRARHTGGRLTVEVEDTGIGIAPEAQSRLFDPFEQASEGYGRTHEGNGLGLAIVRRVAELMDGSVAVESTPGAGSRFTLSLRAD